MTDCKIQKLSTLFANCFPEMENIEKKFFFSVCMPTFNHVYWWLLYCEFQSLADTGKQDPGKQSFGLFVVYLRCEVHRKMGNFFLMLFLIPKCIEHLFRNSLNQLSPSLLNKKFPNKVCTYYSWTQLWSIQETYGL